jgi:hypothetical protein
MPEEVNESLREARRFGDEFGWLAEFVGGILPGKVIEIAKHIAILKQLDFGTTGEFDKRVEDHVDAAIECSYAEYTRSIADTVQDLNAFLQSMQGVFGIHGVKDSTLISLFVQTEDEKLTPRLYAQTTGGVISIESAILDIDLTKI